MQYSRCATVLSRGFALGIRNGISALRKPGLSLNTIQIEGITKQNGLKEIFEPGPFSCIHLENISSLAPLIDLNLALLFRLTQVG